jgi:hypothetical protein
VTEADRANDRDLNVAPTGFHKLLNQHGHGFHYAVLREVQRLFEEHQSGWVFEVAEFPVSVKGVDTRVDLVLRHPNRPFYIVGECKRANPALSNWCFVRAPYTRRDHRQEGIYVDKLSWRDTRSMNTVEVANIAYTSEAYHIALEAKTGALGDPAGRGRGEIDDAATQVLRGVNGLIEAFARAKVPANDEKFLIPVGGGKAAGKLGGKGGANKGGGKGGNAPEAETPESSLAQALEQAPTVGYLWSSESTGYALRFAGKSTQPDGSQRVILITQRRLGAASPLWNPTVAGPSNTYEFSVVELRLNANGQGEGKASLTGQVVQDTSAKIVSVGNYDALPVVFRDVRTRVAQP